MILYFTKKWFRIFGYGLTWQHESEKLMFSERIGKRKSIKIFNYRFRILIPGGI